MTTPIIPQPPPGAPQPGYNPPLQPGYNPHDAKARAKTEKAYRKASRPFYKKKRFIFPAVIIPLLVIIIASTGGGNGGSGSGSSAPVSGTACAAAYPDKQDNDVCADANGAVTLRGVVVTAKPFALVSDGIGGTSLCSDVAIKNTTNKSQDYNEFDFKVQTPNGDVSSLSAQGIGGTLNSGTLVAGGTKNGKICTGDSGEKGQYVFIYKPNAFESDRGIWLFNL